LAKVGRTPYNTTVRPNIAVRKLPAGEKTLPPAPLSVATGVAVELADEADELTVEFEDETSV
jgi:hypothetical protein